MDDSPLLRNPDALVALGIVRNAHGALGDEPGPSDLDLIEQLASRGSVCIVLDPEVLNVEPRVETVEALRQAWKNGTDGFPADIRRHGVRVHLGLSDPSDARALLSVVSHATGVESVTISETGFRGDARWGWPLQIAVIGPEAEHAVATYHNRDLIDIVAPSQPVDLLMIQSQQDLDLIRDRVAGAGLVIMLVDDPADVSLEGARRLNESLGFKVVAMVERAGLAIDGFLSQALDELSHDNPPDIAIVRAMVGKGTYLIAGDPGLLDRARVSVSLKSLEAVLEQEYEAGRLDAPTFGDVMDELTSADGVSDWSSERGAAREHARVTRSARAVLARGAYEVRDTGPRHLQAQVYDVSDGAERRRSRSFKAGGDNEVRVRVGPSTSDWLEEPRPFPDHRLPPDQARLTIRIEAAAVGLNELREVRIPPFGPSNVAAFRFRVTGLDQLEATINVYHEGKELQTAVLRGPVTDREDDPRAVGIEFAREVASGGVVGHQSRFDLTISKRDASPVLIMFDPKAGPDEPSHRELKPSVAGIADQVNEIRSALFDAAARLEDLDGDLATKGLPVLMRLAEVGEYLRRLLFGHEPPDVIRSVQVVSTYSADFFPVEFLYDYVLPREDAVLCPEFTTTSGAECSDSCQAAAGVNRFVCPSGFWALNRVIERQVRPERAGCSEHDATRTNPTISVQSIIFAASDEVNATHPTEVLDAVNDLRSWTAVYQADDWDQWAQLIGEHHPSLLIALPHNVGSKPHQKLQIGAASDLALNRIEPRHFVASGASVGPVVMLLGCNTANAEIQYQDFVAEIRCLGASVILGTLTYVLGRQAVHLARELVSQVWESEGTSMGEILRQVRGQLLTNNNLMGLAVAAYGDADWQFRVREI